MAKNVRYKLFIDFQLFMVMPKFLKYNFWALINMAGSVICEYVVTIICIPSWNTHYVLS